VPHIISGEGIGMDPEKTTVVTEWRHQLTFVKFDHSSVWRRFVQNFASVAAPLHALLTKNHRFLWGHEEQRAFDELKVAVTTPLVLAMPNNWRVYPGY